MSRAQILQRLRAGRTAGRLPEADAPEGVIPTPVSAAECLARFSIEATALGIDCYVETTAADVRQRLAAVVGGAAVLSWDAHYLPYGAYQALLQPIHGDAPRQQQAGAEVGVTGCDAAVAETASLVLFSGPGRARTVSLLPPVHVALVERHQLYYSLAEVFDKERARMRRAASCTVITGPSRTADIELTLTLGIHGPGRVVIVIGP